MMGGIRGDGTVWVAGRMLRIVIISREQSRHHVIDEAGVPAATYIAHAAVEPDHQRPPIVLRHRIFQERRHVVAPDSRKIVRRQLRAPANNATAAAALSSSATFAMRNLILGIRILKDSVRV